MKPFLRFISRSAEGDLYVFAVTYPGTATTSVSGRVSMKAIPIKEFWP